MTRNDATKLKSQNARRNRLSESVVYVAWSVLFAVLALTGVRAQQKPEGLTLRPTREITFATEEGTWMSLDVSSDGKNIVFDLAGHLYTLTAQGGEGRAITQGLSFEAQPRFSPDAKQIVYVSDRSGTDNLWISDADGSNPRALTAEVHTMFTSPSWTSDGRYILVSRRQPRFHDSAFELWMYDTQGGSGIRVTKSKATPDAPMESWHNALGAVASPDGKYFYYATKRGKFSLDVEFPLWQIARRDRRTGEEAILTNAQGSAVRPCISPDGSQMVYATRYDAGTALRLRDLATGEERWLKYPVQRDDQESLLSSRDVFPGYAFTPDGKNLVLAYGGRIRRLSIETGAEETIAFHATISRQVGSKLYFPRKVEEGPIAARLIQGAVESPDGQHVAFSSLTHLYEADWAGEKEARRVTASNAREYEPAWSPDGKSIAYVTWDSGQGFIWKVAAEPGAQPIKLTETSAFYCNPSWSPDGNTIVALRSPRTRILEQGSDSYDEANPLELISIPAQGGAVRSLAPPSEYLRPHFAGPEARLYVTEFISSGLGKGDHRLVSMEPDGHDRRVILTITGKNIWGPDFSPPVQITASPDGRKASAIFRSQLFLFDLPAIGGEPPAIDLTSPPVAVRRLTTIGADFASWADEGRMITWSVGSTFFRLPLADLDAGVAESPAATALESASSQGNSTAWARKLRPQQLRISVQAPRSTPHGSIVLKGARIITMQDDEVLSPGDIVIRDNRIEAIGPSGSVPFPNEAKVMDVTGTTIVPGFIDTHAHWSGIRRGILDLQNPDFLATLAYGITSGRDPQTGTNDIFAYQDLIDAGEIVGPRAYSTGPGIFWTNDFQSEEDAEDVVKRYRDYYRTNLIKSYMVGDRRQREFVVEACQKLGVMPTTEGGSDLAMDLTHAIDGFSGNEHQLPIAPVYADVVNLFAKSGIFYTPTLVISELGSPGSENQYYQATDVHDDPKLRRFTPHSILDSKSTRMKWFRKDEYVYPAAAASAAAILRGGGKVCVGGHGELQGLSFHWELWTQQSGGMTNLEALRTATLNGAEAIGLAQDLGSLAPGKLADLVVLDKDPLLDIRNTTSIRYVMKNGELREGDTLNRIWPDKQEVGPFWWWNDHP